MRSENYHECMKRFRTCKYTPTFSCVRGVTQETCQRFEPDKSQMQIQSVIPSRSMTLLRISYVAKLSHSVPIWILVLSEPDILFFWRVVLHILKRFTVTLQWVGYINNLAREMRHGTADTAPISPVVSYLALKNAMTQTFNTECRLVCNMTSSRGR
jgi:hypothetical protein